MADNLFPCPFCGGKAEIRSHDEGCAAWVACTCCGGQSGGFQDCGLPLNALRDRAIHEWNNRFPLNQGFSEFTRLMGEQRSEG